MKIVNHNIMVRQAAIRLIAMAVLLTDSMQIAAANEGSTATSILINAKQPMYAGRSYEIVCRAIGWEVAPKTIWWLGEKMQINSMQQLLVSEERNESMSILLLTPLPEDNGKTLKCRTEDSRGVQETSVELLVYYPPEVSVDVQPPLQADDLREGDNVSLICHVNASPPVFRVRWIFQGRIMQETYSNGPLNDSLTLRLKSIHRRQAGNYSCIVSNAMDEVESPPIELIIKYRPVCQLSRPVVYAARLGETLRLECGGQGAPAVFAYRWMFSRAEHSEAQPTQWHMRAPDGEKITFVEWENGVSSRLYQPKSDFDYGTFYCSAKNVLGLQQQPCVIHIVPPGRPRAPSYCSVLNETSHSFSVRCPTKRDGGFRQRYVLEVFDAFSGQVKFNKTQKLAAFLVDGLEPNTATTMRIAAFSPRGRSDWVRMNTATLPPPPPPTAAAATTAVTEEKQK